LARRGGPDWQFWTVAALVLALGGLLAFAQVDLALGGDWSLAPLPGLHPYPVTSLLPAITVLLIAGAILARLAWPPREVTRRRAAAGVTVLCAASLALSITLDWGLGAPFALRNAVAATWSTISNGYFREAQQITSVGEFVSQYHEIQRRDPLKLGTHPPGAVLCYWLAKQVWDALPAVQPPMLMLTDAWSGGDLVTLSRSALATSPTVPREFGPGDVPVTVWCLLFIAATGAGVVVPTYLLGAADGDRRTGLLSATLVALAPNTLFYYLSLDVLLMTLTAWALVRVAYRTRDQSPWRGGALGSGAALGVALLISLGATAPLALALAWLVVTSRRTGARAAGRAALELVLGVLLVLGLASLAGLHTLTVFGHCLDAHAHSGGGIAHRHYVKWVLPNLLDYALLLGIPLVWVALTGLARRRELGPCAAGLVVATVATMLLLDLSGSVKGEAERLWIFFNPPLAVAAATLAAGRAALAWPLACQPLQLLLMALTLPPLVRPY